MFYCFGCGYHFFQSSSLATNLVKKQIFMNVVTRESKLFSTLISIPLVSGSLVFLSVCYLLIRIVIVSYYWPKFMYSYVPLTSLTQFNRLNNTLQGVFHWSLRGNFLSRSATSTSNVCCGLRNPICPKHFLRFPSKCYHSYHRLGSAT